MEKDHLEILLEDMSSKFDLVLEAHVALRSQIERLEQKVEQGDAHSQFLIGALSQRIDAVDNKVDAVEKKLGNRIDTIEERLGEKIDALAADLAGHRRDTEAHFGVSRVCER